MVAQRESTIFLLFEGAFRGSKSKNYGRRRRSQLSATPEWSMIKFSFSGAAALLTLPIFNYYCHTDYLLLFVRIMPERSSFRAYTAIMYLDPRMKIYIQVRETITCPLACSVNSAPSRLSFLCHRTKRCRPSDWRLACINPSKWLVNLCCTF